MKKQVIVAAAGILLVAFLFIFGRTTEVHKIHKKPDPPKTDFDVAGFINTLEQKLPPAQAQSLSTLENEVKNGDGTPQQLKACNELANFWKDSVREFIPYAFWISKAAKLDNSEKKLTFAAQLFLDNLRGEEDDVKLSWETNEAISLFEKAIELNPENDDLKIGLGSCYIYGKGRKGNPQETMKGIQQVLSVARKDSTNMKAQMILGVGGYVSGQYDKAIERFQKVLAHEPENIEAVAFLADTYAARGDKEEAKKWYTISKRMVNNPQYSKEVDERIKMLQ